MKKKSSGGGGANWMDTYGDMVTLLLCFFVLLFAMSTLDKEKMMQIVQAFNPDQIVETDPGFGNSGTNDNPMEGMTQTEVEQAMENLLQSLQAYAEEQADQVGGGQQPSISVTKGDGYIYVSFDDAVFFEGNRYTLLESGKLVLNEVALLLAAEKDALDEIRVLGHTAQASPGEANNPTTDRMLSTNRANVVLVYLQEQSGLDPARMVSMGYGQHRPVASNETGEERAKNRRVEMVISGIDTMNPSGDAVSQYYTDRGIENPAPSEVATAAPTPAPTGAAES